eukprot:1261956-Pyramimonas_sp.AAC.1
MPPVKGGVCEGTSPDALDTTPGAWVASGMRREVLPSVEGGAVRERSPKIHPPRSRYALFRSRDFQRLPASSGRRRALPLEPDSA